MTVTTTICTDCHEVYGRDVVDPLYLPFPAALLQQHFAPVASGGQACRHVHYYRKGAEQAQEHRRTHRGAHTAACEAGQHQIEKDERFWIASALLAAFHAADRIEALSALLSCALGARPPVQGDFPTWGEALGAPDDLRLYFEANLPAPVAYKEAFARGLPLNALLPHQRQIAEGHLQRYLSAPTAGGPALEGKTWVDAILVSRTTGLGVVFEAKVLSDTSAHTTYDARRNQIARNLDVLLERHHDVCPELAARRPGRSCFVLVAPQLLEQDRSARLYGHLMTEYARDTSLLRKHLPHRSEPELRDLPGRLGWLTWERLGELVPGACPWL